MKKVLFVIILLMSICFSNNFTFGQSPPSESSKDLSYLTITSVPPLSGPNDETLEEYHKLKKRGVNNMVGFVVFGGIGATLLAFQPTPYVNYSTSTRFWCGVTFCSLSGIELIMGIVNLSHAHFVLNQSKKITLTPSKQNVGVAINF